MNPVLIPFNSTVSPSAELEVLEFDGPQQLPTELIGEARPCFSSPMEESDPSCDNGFHVISNPPPTRLQGLVHYSFPSSLIPPFEASEASMTPPFVLPMAIFPGGLDFMTTRPGSPMTMPPGAPMTNASGAPMTNTSVAPMPTPPGTFMPTPPGSPMTKPPGAPMTNTSGLPMTPPPSSQQPSYAGQPTTELLHYMRHFNKEEFENAAIKYGCNGDIFSFHRCLTDRKETVRKMARNLRTWGFSNLYGYLSGILFRCHEPSLI